MEKEKKQKKETAFLDGLPVSYHGGHRSASHIQRWRICFFSLSYEDLTFGLFEKLLSLLLSVFSSCEGLSVNRYKRHPGETTTVSSSRNFPGLPDLKMPLLLNYFKDEICLTPFDRRSIMSISVNNIVIS